jgi:hypothetical protein
VDVQPALPAPSGAITENAALLIGYCTIVIKVVGGDDCTPKYYVLVSCIYTSWEKCTSHKLFYKKEKKVFCRIIYVELLGLSNNRAFCQLCNWLMVTGMATNCC